MTALLDEATVFEDFVAALTHRQARDLRRLVDELAVRLRRFSQRAGALGAPQVTLRPARLALAALADQKVRGLRGVDATAWAALARQALFEGRDIDLTDLAGFQRVAQTEGYDNLSVLLDRVLAKLNRRAREPRPKERLGLAVGAVVVAVTFAMLTYLAWMEDRFHAQALGAFTDHRATLDLGQTRQSADVLSGLGALSADLANVETAVASAPLRGVVTLPFADAVGEARVLYQASAGQAVGPLLAEAIALALATEGQGLALYDSLRAHAILTGQTDWEPGFLTGWIAARENALGLAGFAAHVPTLTGPVPGLLAVEQVVLEQARGIAAETTEAERAWLEMLRAPDVAALPPWRAAEVVPGLLEVTMRRSGAALAVPGLYTRAGWDKAQTTAAGVAVTKSRKLAQALFGRSLPQENDTVDQVMARLQAETIATWKDWLADLRVRPFDTPERGIILSGLLSQANSPLPALITALWEEVGGNDRARPRPLQTEIARAFGPTIQYVEQGRMEEIAGLFAAVNVALVTRDQNAARGEHAVMQVAERARSVQSLRAAPRLVVQLVEDTLAQISAPVVSADTPMAQSWARVFGVCQQELTGRYPFGPGAPITEAALARLLGPQGLIPQFFAQFARPNMAVDESPWRWKTEARFAGLSPESASFLERAMAIRNGLFSEQGLGAEVTLATLAERGQATLRLGGQTASLRANANASRVRWPGPVPAQGMSLQFGAAPESAALTRPGTWGLMQVLDGLRARPRDDGQRFLIDMRDASGRIFVEATFDDPLNPIAVRPLMQDLTCPPQL